MANVTVHTTPTSIRSYGTVAAAANLLDVLDLRTALKAFLFVIAARQGTTSLTGNPLQIVVRPTYGDVAERSPVDCYGRSAVTTAACNSTTTSTTMTAGSTTSITVSSATGIAVDTLLGIEVGTSNFEVVRVSKVASTTITFDAPVIKSHSGTVTVTTLAEAWTIELPGGAKYEIVTEYGGASAGSTYDVKIIAQVHDYDVIT